MNGSSAPMQVRILALMAPAVGGCDRAEAAVEADHRLDVRTRAGELERHGAAEAEANGADAARIDLRPGAQRGETGAGSSTRLRRIGIKRLEQLDGRPELVDQQGVAMQVAGERDIAHARETLRAAQGMLPEPERFRKHQHRRSPARPGADEQLAPSWSPRRLRSSVARAASFPPTDGTHRIIPAASTRRSVPARGSAWV